MKKFLSILLTAVMLLSVVSASFVSFAESGTAYKAGEVIKFGNYPQSQVKDKALIDKLNDLDFRWKSYGYYDGNNSLDGEMSPTDKMKYADVVLDGAKYRAVKLTAYRPVYSGAPWDTASNSGLQFDYGYELYEIYWFKFEPINWIVLDPVKGLVLSEALLDSQPYHNFILGTWNENENKYDAPYYGDSAKTTHITNYSSSSIRQWLTEDFYNTAFTDSQKANLKTTKLENKSFDHVSYDYGYGENFDASYDAPETNDKVFLLSLADVLDYLYDPGEDELSELNLAKVSDYALSQGCWIETDSGKDAFGCGAWWIRSAADSVYSVYLWFDSSGPYFDWTEAVFNALGIRPACVLKKLGNDYCMHFNTGTKKDNVVNASCKKAGSYDEVSYCKDCGVELSRTQKTIDKLAHTYKNDVTPATTTKDGKIVPTCSECGATKTAKTIAKASGVKISKAKFAYTGKVQVPTLTVKDSAGNDIASKYYTATWSNASSKNVGTYTVTVKFKGNYSGTQKFTYTIVPAKVTGLKTSKAATNAITLTWTKATGAKYYEVYGSADGGKTFKKIATPSTNTCKVTKVAGKAIAAGKAYQFKVRALDSSKKLIGSWSAVLKTGSQTAAPKISKLTTKSKQITVTWGKVTGAKSYTVYTSTDGKTYKAAKSGVTKTTCTITGLKGGKRIYVKVLAVNAYKVKSAYSGAKYITVKK